MSKFLSGTLRKLLVGITGYTENKTVIQTTGKVGIGTTDAQQHSLFVVGSTNITGDTIVGGGLTAVGIGSFQSDVYIDNQLFVGGVNITGGASVGEDITTRNLKATGISTFVGITTVESTLFTNQLSVAGVSTFNGNVDANGDLDVDGRTELDITNISETLNVVGISTFSSDVDINASIDIDGHTELDNVNISGVTTFADAIDANGDLDVDGHTDLDNVSISGVTTTTGLLDANGGLTANEATVEDLTNNRIVIAGVGGRLEDSANLTFDGVTLDVVGQTEVDRLNVSGIATFAGNIDANGDLDVDGQTELDDVNVSGIATIQNLDVQGDFDVYDTEAVFHNNVYIAGNLGIGGTATVITAQDLQVFDRDIILGITTDSNGEDISNDTTANHGGVAVASTVGSPLVDLALEGFSDLLPTYKQLMWVAANSYGVGTTDAWHFNYAVGIGSTLVPNGTRFAVKEIQVTDNTIKTPNLNVTGVGTIAVLHAPSITPDGTDFGTSGYFPKADGSGGWEWADVPGLFSVNNILNGFNVSEEGSIVGTAGSITQIDFRGANIVATADPQPNGIATITMSDTPTFDELTVSGTTQTQQLNVTGVSTFQGAAGFGGNVTVTGISTFVGVGTFNGDLYVGGDLYVADDLVFDSFTAREINVTERSNLHDLYVAGVSTFVGFATAQDTLFANQLNVSGVSTFYDRVIFDSTNSIQIPVGTEGEKDAVGVAVTGQIRFNTTNQQFEGFGVGNNWGSLGGVKDVDGDTYILAETTAGSDEDILYFYTGGNLSGILSTAGADFNVDLNVDGHTELDNLNVSGVSTFNGTTEVKNSSFKVTNSSVPTQYLEIVQNGDSSLNLNKVGAGAFYIEGNNIYLGDDDSTQTYAGFERNGKSYLNYNGITRLETTGYGITVYDTIQAPQLNISGIASVGSAITMYGATGIVSAISFYGDGANLTNTGATLSAASGTQRLVLTSLTSGTMVDAATDGDLTFDANYNLLSVPSINVSTAATFGGTISAGNTVGTSGQYLQSTGVGVTWANFPSLRTTQANVATDNQTAFVFTYNVNFLDVFVNGVKLATNEYTATNGTDITLTSPAFGGDIVEFHSYNTSALGSSGSATVLNDLTDVTISPLSDNQILQYNSSSGLWENVSFSSVSSTKSVGTYTATSSQTTFGATYDVGYVDVYLNGSKLSEDQYTATNGTSVVLDTGATAGDIVEIVGFKGTTGGFAQKSVSRHTATSLQTSFSATYDVGYVDVYLNGVKLSEDQYTATDGASIVLDTGATAGDVLEIVGLRATPTGGGGGTTIVGAGGTWATDAVGINTVKSVGIGTEAQSGYKLYVEGDARVTGILTVGPASVTIDGINNEVTVGTGITLYGNTGIISATSLNVTGALSGDASSLTGLTGASAATYGNGSAVPQITVDANGRITGISNVLISGGGGGGSSIIIKDDNSLVGTAGTINFGTGLTVSSVVDSAVTITVNGSELTSLNATQLTSGTVPDARFPATLPSASGANLTSLNASNLGSGTIPDARFPATLPAVSGANLTNITPAYVSAWTLTGNGSEYFFSGSGFDGTETNPDLYLVRGQKYRFNASGSHPFQIQSTFGAGGTVYNDGVTNNNSAAVDFNVQNDAPDVLFYQCTNHSGMRGKIIILGDRTIQGSWTAAAGVLENIDTITGISSINIKSAEYTLHIEHSSGMQAQKVLAMQTGSTAYSQEFAIMYDSDLLVSVGSSVHNGNFYLNATPETGITGITTYRFTRQTMR